MNFIKILESKHTEKLKIKNVNNTFLILKDTATNNN